MKKICINVGQMGKKNKINKPCPHTIIYDGKRRKKILFVLDAEIIRVKREKEKCSKAIFCDDDEKM